MLYRFLEVYEADSRKGLDLPSKTVSAALQIGADLSPFMYFSTTSRMHLLQCSPNTQSSFKDQNLAEICPIPCCTQTKICVHVLRGITKAENNLKSVYNLAPTGWILSNRHIHPCRNRLHLPPNLRMNKYWANFSLLLFMLPFHVFYIEGYLSPKTFKR